MEIVLKGKLASIFTDSVEMINSIRNGNPKEPDLALKKELEKIRGQIFSSPETIQYFPSYLVLAIFRHVKFNNNLYVCQECKDGCYPNWEEIKQDVLVSKELLLQIKELQEAYPEMDEKVKQAIFLAFCIQHQKTVRVEEPNEILSGDMYQKIEYDEREEGYYE
ncbi:hypothetical protein DRJ25_05555 [Candidatus Woesearchaeota archaeon]|nr:MAG: hypothetical protein DRJ25_05555 [Candidatus Woesearchaeota archaeon]